MEVGEWWQGLDHGGRCEEEPGEQAWAGLWLSKMSLSYDLHFSKITLAPLCAMLRGIMGLSRCEANQLPQEGS